ncbi:SufS family cysteine desulfurase [Halostella salina]|uniref:SufS family cysteine desulfurase n=1 Tax=Halostella salina TaxID=1547897 RepID=UPI000EF85110
MHCDIPSIREDFPVLDREVADLQLTYFDNAATTQTPKQVYRVFEEFYSEYNANIHRGIHTLSHEASVAYEKAHDKAAEFIGASGGRKELIFTKNTTESINLVAYGLGLNELDADDVIVTTEMEHHATLVTWQQVAKETGADIRYVEVTEDGHLDMEHAKGVIGDDTAIVVAAHVSNVLGTINPIPELAELAHENDAYILVDGAQSAPTRPVDVEALDVDFFTFSGHKMAGPTGIGGLYGKQHLLEEMDPFLYGGEMIQHVSLRDATWNDLPWKFEAGTPPIAEGIALGAAIDYLEDIGMEAVRRHENELAQYTLEQLERRDDVETYGPPPGTERSGLVAFNIDGVHGHDVSSLLNDRGIAVRAGDHCTQPLHDALDIPGSVRASFYIYNTKDEIDRLLHALDTAAADLPQYLASDRYHDSIAEHYRQPHNCTMDDEPTFLISYQEMTCGDQAQFAVRVTESGRIEKLSFETESCAVSQAVASILATYLEGQQLENVAERDDIIGDLIDGQFPELRHDCVVGPEEVIKEGIRAKLDQATDPTGLE